MNELGQLIRRRREELGLTQDELARQLGYKHRTTIAKIESGDSSIRLRRLSKFAQVLGISPSDLYPTPDPEPEAEPLEPTDPDTTGVSPLGKRIMYRREWLRMSQSELALKVGLTDRSSISNIETGVNHIPVEKVRAFADALRVSVGELLDCNDAEWATFCKIWKLLNE